MEVFFFFLQFLLFQPICVLKAEVSLLKPLSSGTVCLFKFLCFFFFFYFARSVAAGELLLVAVSWDYSLLQWTDFSLQ